MPLPAGFNVHGAFQLEVVGRLHGQYVENVWTGVYPGEVGQPDWAAFLTQLSTAMLACYVDTLLPGLSADLTLEQVIATKMGDVDPVQITNILNPKPAGGSTASLPSDCAGTLQLKTNFRGRSHRGRKSIPGIPEASHANSLITDPTLAAIIAFAACVAGKFLHPNGTEDARLTVFSPTLAAANNNAVAASHSLVSSLNPGLVMGSMASRKVGRGI